MWIQRLLTTDDGYAPLLLRLGLGLVILPHGLQKTLGWFGGYGFGGTMQFFTETMGIPWIFALAAVVVESLGALLLLLGLGTRINAVLIGFTMLVAMWMVHLQHGFFMNWYGSQTGEGVEYFLLVFALAGALTLVGGGRLSLDGRLTRSAA